MKKKKVLYQSDYSLAKTGFGRVTKAILSYLYNTGKYDIVNYACGLNFSNPELERTPWKSIGSLPDSKDEIDQLNKDPNLARLAAYGAHLLDRVIKQEKPDVYFAVQDIWGVDFAVEKPWFNKINSIIWTTLDSLPILPSALACANKIKNYWIWSDFATKSMQNLGFSHIKTMHGPIDDRPFYRLKDEERLSLRKRFNINDNAFVIGFVFRNQLRKSVPNLLEGYYLWKKSNPKIKNTSLLLHTNWSEGWNIPKLAAEYNIPLSEILTTYICKNCSNYEVKPFAGQDLTCKYCGQNKCQSTASVSLGVNENQLNEIYNLMDVYCHPFTSGGQEIPIQEAKLTELITLVTNYSCGEEMCADEAGSLPLDWSSYREHGTEFIKASTKPNSIAKQLNKVYLMTPDKRKDLGKKARAWTIENYSINVIGKKIEEFIDSLPEIEYDFSFDEVQKDPFCEIDDIKDDSKWIEQLYTKILKRPEVDENDDGHKYWMEQIQKGTQRIDIEKYFRHVAEQENRKNKTIKFEDLLDKNDRGKRILYVMPETEKDLFLSTSLFKSIREAYPNHNLYVATKPDFFDILDGNSDVFKVIQYIPQMDSLLWLEGYGNHEGFFEIAFLPHLTTNKFIDYTHNGKSMLTV